ncbi:FAD-dependent monooxygenase [Aureispira anguillae]|uniref:FAD-dependent monooxygenase n=1 Tax=Aureispira anguillae TaxID=2864201 RepID=A0A915YGT9_9BACT|nr:FAD-dependent monooxygenase [Aureispira anguillae]BDS12884.1 FAD-dependent monooxygenase [Aureispira anguillae]
MNVSKIPVIIIGAGPTGLMAAAQLQRFNIPYRIIEKRKGTTAFSKALGVQARTMEIYDQMGIAEKAISLGLAVKEVQIMAKGQYVQTMPLSKAGINFTPFPYLFILEQSRNEELIHEYIQSRGGKVEWQTEMTHFEVQKNGAYVCIKKQDGSEEHIHADWVIAADGGRSPVRHALNIPFKGDTYKNVFYVVDTEVNWEKDHNSLHMNLADNNFTAFFPITDEKGTRFRLVGILPEHFYDKKDISFEDIQQNIQALQHLDLTFGKTHWFSVYRVHHRCIDNFRMGPVFFAGDAAHVHSPAGGQGMNTGLQDAYNLAWKLALVVSNKAPKTLLDSYHKERWPFANQLVNTTDRAFTSVVKKGTLINWVRLNIMPFLISRLMGISKVQQRAFRIVSQTGISYPESPIAVGAVYLSKKAPHPGDRLPFLKVYNTTTAQQESLYHRLGEQFFHAIVWLKASDKQLDAVVQDLKQYLDDRYPNLFQTHIISERAENTAVFQQLDLDQSLLFIVRPDNYIGYIGKINDQQALENYLNLILL